VAKRFGGFLVRSRAFGFFRFGYVTKNGFCGGGVAIS
jgi:hypothetical protein